MNYSPVKLAFALYEAPRPSNENLSPIIFLHGCGDSKEIWGDIPQKVADRANRKVYALDARNHGDSEWTAKMNFDMNVDDLVHFMDTHSIERSVLVGHSMGGVTCNKTAVRFPHRVDRIFVEDQYVDRVDQKTLNSALKYFQLCEEAAKHIPPDCEMREVHKHIADYLYENGLKHKDAGSRESLDKIFFAMKRTDDGKYVWKTNWKTVQEAMRDGTKLASEIQGVYNGPAHFIYGSLSVFRIGEKVAQIRKYFPKAEFYCVKGADHYVHPHHPEKFTKIIVDCLLKKWI